MKKTLIFASVVLLLASCDKNDYPGPENSFQTTLRTANLIISKTNSDDVMAVPNVDHTFTFDLAQNYMRIATEGFNLDAANKITFESPENSGTYRYEAYNEGVIYRFSVPEFTSDNHKFSNMKGIVTTVYPFIDGYSTNHDALTIMSYDIDDKYTVKTFPVGASYIGKTISTYKDKEGNDKRYENGKTVYQVMMDIATKTAVVKIIKPQFAEEMPSTFTYMLLSGLTVEFNNRGYIVSGENIVPKVGDEATPFPAFTFTKFQFQVDVDNMTTGNIVFNVANRYDARMTGSYIYQ